MIPDCQTARNVLFNGELLVEVGVVDKVGDAEAAVPEHATDSIFCEAMAFWEREEVVHAFFTHAIYVPVARLPALAVFQRGYQPLATPNPSL